MDCKHKFFRCELCGNMVGLIEDKGNPIVCCGAKMTQLIPNTVEASTEKHIPEFEITGSVMNVQVGSVPHPMEEAHHINFIYVASEHGGQRKCLKIGSEPKAIFCFADDKPVAVYAYCNLHGLWVKDV
ncbi:MAG: desulfoferrodoxin [Oscillospiraceae bacterium]|jgi:superoxide reductase|nr:desulfoferrodoxin [Oscillospiraceae bacterium]